MKDPEKSCARSCESYMKDQEKSRADSAARSHENYKNDLEKSRHDKACSHYASNAHWKRINSHCLRSH